MPGPRRGAIAPALFLFCLGLAGCGGGNDDGGSSSSEDGGGGFEVLVDDEFPVGPDGHKLAIQCWGEGSPAVIFESGFGSSALADYYNPEVLPDIAAEGTVCLYDRAGEGFSDELPKERRTLSDLTDDLHELLAAAEIAPPYVLVAHSFGGFVAVDYAGTYPDDVTGLVLLEVPPPNPASARKDPAIQWDSPENRTRIDSVEAETTLSNPAPINDIPVRVVSGTESELSAKSQEFWLDLSPQAEQVTLETRHEVFAEDPEGVTEIVVDVMGDADD